MPADVKKALVDVIVENSPTMSPIDAERFLNRMEREKRFCVEAWS